MCLNLRNMNQITGTIYEWQYNIYLCVFLCDFAIFMKQIAITKCSYKVVYFFNFCFFVLSFWFMQNSIDIKKNLLYQVRNNTIIFIVSFYMHSQNGGRFPGWTAKLIQTSSVVASLSTFVELCSFSASECAVLIDSLLIVGIVANLHDGRVVRTRCFTSTKATFVLGVHARRTALQERARFTSAS